MEYFYILLALIAGILMPVQPGINAQLSSLVKNPLLASAISFAFGTIVLLIYCLLARVPWPSWSTIASAPWWIWIGGVLGAFFVTSTIILAPKIGAVTMLALLVLGQMVASLILDHFGWLGYPLHPISFWRIVGVIFLVIGVFLVQRF
jgi:transporter family-2 protein